MNLIDTHTHIFLPEFDQDREAILQRAVRIGIQSMLLPNIDADTVKPMLQLCSMHPDLCKPMIGLHPGSVNEFAEAFLDRIPELIVSNRFVAIGECGLDLFWRKDNLKQQEDVLLKQCEIALQYDLPLVLHSRDAFYETLAVVEKANGYAAGKTLRGVFHCFTGDARQAGLAIEIGFYLGIGGVLTYKNSDLANQLKEINPEHLLLETDAPYLPPVPYRGKRNEPAYLLEVVNALSRVYKKSASEIATITSLNASRLFSLA